MNASPSRLKDSQDPRRKSAASVAAFFAFIFLAVFSQYASARNSRIHIDQRLLVSVVQYPKFQSVRILGVVHIGDEAKISEALSVLVPGKNIRLWVGGFGGGWTPTVEAMRDRFLEVCDPEKGCQTESLVHEGKSCTSACIVLFMTGQTRTSGVTSTFGFHSSYVNLPFKLKIPEYGKYAYSNAGVSSQWISSNSRLLEGDDVTFVKGSELKESNIVTRVIDFNRAKTIWAKAR